MRESGVLAHKPANLSYEEAATIPYGAMVALKILAKVTIQAGQKVLVNGASGGIGSYAVQIAKSLGAEVTGVCGTPRLDFVKSIGADHVIDYTREDFTHNGKTYDLILDVLGKTSFSKIKNSLNENGCLLLASFKTPHILQGLCTSFIGNKRVICALVEGKTKDLEEIKGLVEAGKLTVVVDRCYPLEQTAEAHRYIEQGQKRGPVVITMAANS
jgi:NADPH:quinone reductase-like Zn-dependent oxidoreductase